MNILSLNNIQRHNVNAFRTNRNKNMTATEIRQLSSDTVSFSGTKNKDNKQPETENIEDIEGKVLKGRTKDISYKMGKEIHEASAPALKPFVNKLKKGLSNLVESPVNPENPIAAAPIGIKGRVKSANSIIEKALSNKLVTKSEISNMGDIVAARIVLRESSQESFDKVFRALEKLVISGDLVVKEVENYRFSPKDSYISNKTLLHFEETCVKSGLNPDIVNKTRENGYTAVHLTVILPNKQLAEIQIMGRDVEQVKEIEDFYYKLNCKKDFAAKYKGIQKMMTEKLAKLTDFQKETLKVYIRDSYIHAKEIPATQTTMTYPIKNFINIPYSLPEELGFKHLYKMKEACDRAANRTHQL